MLNPIRLGFIGCGKHALVGHIFPALNMQDNFSMTAVFDTNRRAMENAAHLSRDKNTQSKPVYLAESVDDLLCRENIDAVVIATPPEFHIEQAEKAISAGKHVLCEKPLWVGVNNNERGLAIIKQAVDKKLVFTSCHPRRFEPEYAKIKSSLPMLIDKHGKVVEVRYRFFYHVPSSEWRKSDSLLLDHLNHEIDLVNFILGHSSWMLIRTSDGFDSYHARGSRGDGVVVSFSGSRYLKTKIYRNEFELIFERGRVLSVIKLDNRERSATKGMIRSSLVTDNFEVYERYRYTHAVSKRKANTPFIAAMNNFAKSIRGGEENYLTPQDLAVNTISCNCLAERGGYYS